MSRDELMNKIVELDNRILSLLDPLEISRLIMEREELLASIPEIKLGLEDAYSIAENNNKIMNHLKNIEADLKRRLRDVKYYSDIYGNYYLSSYKLRDNLLSKKV